MITESQGIIVLPRLQVQNANTISSPLTWGFPAISSILGFVHALERKLVIHGTNLRFGGVGIICHGFEPQISQSTGISDKAFCLTRNPLEKDGGSAAIVEEGRAHMNISLIIQVFGEECSRNDSVREHLVKEIYEIAQCLRIAGGSLLPVKTRYQPEFLKWPSSIEEQERLSKKIMRRLLPGFALISREELLAESAVELRERNPEATALDALLDYSSLHFTPDNTNLEAKTAEWAMSRLGSGWLVPIPVGYSAISELYSPGSVLNTRDNTTPFRFVESIYSLGEWRSPHRITDLNEIFWHYQADVNNGLYRCINPKTSTYSQPKEI